MTMHHFEQRVDRQVIFGSKKRFHFARAVFLTFPRLNNADCAIAVTLT